MPDAKEVATLTFGSKNFEDWETVWVQCNWTDGFHQFKFRCAERVTAAPVVPGDECEIKLGGELVVTGVVLSRQVAYEGEQHGVEIQGVSIQWFAGRGSVDHPTSNFDGKTFRQIAEEVLKQTDVTAEFKGDISEEKFDNHCVLHNGDTVFDFLERLARQRQIIIASTKDKKYVFVGKHTASVVGKLVEGVNIKKCQAVISIAAQQSEYVLRAQTSGSNDSWGKRITQMEARAKGSCKYKCPSITACEHPVKSDPELLARCDMESMWHEGNEMQITITVQGWFTQAGKLWVAGEDVDVDSPMVPINGKMKIQSVTFTQDSEGGTLTTLLVVAPWGLNESPYLPPTSKITTNMLTVPRY